MLSLLHIENIAVIESADIVFGDGFNALTGETGAGKSIVIDAIGAVMGERTSRDLIRTGAKSAIVSAVFIDVIKLSWFEEMGIGPDENGELLIQREIQGDGKNICRVNGKPVTVTQLKVLGQQLLNVHGQHDGQQLLDEKCHLDYLDRFGGTEQVYHQFQESYQAVNQLSKEIKSLQMNEAEKSRRIDSLQFQINELERGDLKAGEEEELSERRTMLRHATKLIDAVEGAHFALSGDDDNQGAVALIMSGAQSLHQVGSLSEDMNQAAVQMEELRCIADDMAELIRDLRGKFDCEPDELDQIETRLDQLHRLKKKYGNSVEEMLNYLETSKKELDDIQYASDIILRLEKKLEAALKSARSKAEILSEMRKKEAKILENRIQVELKQLDMPKVLFKVEFSVKTCEHGMDDTGMDDVQFLMSANVGEDLKPIQKVASGGELARIMLVLKNVLAENDHVATLVFDEVDTGVSGRAAQKVAEKMADVARHKQVLCVTHLPQIAAMADVHFSVEKGVRNERTFTAVEQLTRERRQEELARLTGGATVTQVMLESAGQLLDEAELYRGVKHG